MNWFEEHGIHYDVCRDMLLDSSGAQTTVDYLAAELCRECPEYTLGRARQMVRIWVIYNPERHIGSEEEIKKRIMDYVSTDTPKSTCMVENAFCSKCERRVLKEMFRTGCLIKVDGFVGPIEWLYERNTPFSLQNPDEIRHAIMKYIGYGNEKCSSNVYRKFRQHIDIIRDMISKHILIVKRVDKKHYTMHIATGEELLSYQTEDCMDEGK